MGSNVFSAIDYRNAAGREIFKSEFLMLEPPDMAKALAAIRVLENFGNLIPRSMSKKIRGDIYELRLSGNKKEIRLLYAFRPDKIILLLSCFIKKTQKTPENEITKAETRLREYESQRRH